jgi:O-antigen/teichoic acid export membrane protein
MDGKRRIAFNVIWNWAGMVASILSGLVAAPFLVRTLDETGYGLWILIASLSGYFGLLDLGVRGSVGRNLAFYRARGDRPQVNAVLSTALALLAVPALLSIVGAAGLAPLFGRLFEVPERREAAVHFALLLTGVNLAVSILFSVFDATLWSMQRFDVLNIIDIPVALVRLLLILLLVDQRTGLESLSVITLVSTVLALAAKALVTFYLDRALRIGVRQVTRPTVHLLVNFGVWSWLLSLSRMVSSTYGPIVIGAQLGVASVTPYSIAARLVGLANGLLMTASGVLTPVATSLHATDQLRQQQKLVLEGGKYCLALSLFFVGGFILLGEAFLDLWMGRLVAAAYPALVILALGEVLPLSQWAGGGMIVGMGRHRVLACAGLAENAAFVALSYLLAETYGLLGVCWAIALPAFFCRGLLQLWMVCRAVDLSLDRYVREAMLSATLAAVGPILVLTALTFLRPVQSWIDLLVYAGLFALVYAVSCAIFIAKLRYPAAHTARLASLTIPSPSKSR